MNTNIVKITLSKKNVAVLITFITGVLMGLARKEIPDAPPNNLTTLSNLNNLKKKRILYNCPDALSMSAPASSGTTDKTATIHMQPIMTCP
jgi:hypothetical protein